MRLKPSPSLFLCTTTTKLLSAHFYASSLRLKQKRRKLQMMLKTQIKKQQAVCFSFRLLHTLNTRLVCVKPRPVGRVHLWGVSPRVHVWENHIPPMKCRSDQLCVSGCTVWIKSLSSSSNDRGSAPPQPTLDSSQSTQKDGNYNCAPF